EEDAAPAELAANLLALRQLARPHALCRLLQHPPDPSLNVEEIAQLLVDRPPEELLTRLSEFAWGGVETRLMDRALAILEAARASKRYTLPDDPAFAATPYLLTPMGLPKKAVGWIADKHGWLEGDDGWDNVFLPLQTQAVIAGIA